jgi:hypothetical protein
MATVSLEQDARYRQDGDRFVETCKSCGADRAGDACACGGTFEKLKRGFFVTSWTPASFEILLPDVCPHCEQTATRARTITMRLPTARKTWTAKTVSIPSCSKMLPPYLAWLLFVASGFWLVVFGLAAVFGNGAPAIIGTVLAAAACVASWRAYGWIRFGSFDHRSFRFRARRRSYAVALAKLNNGRVL